MVEIDKLTICRDEKEKSGLSRLISIRIEELSDLTQSMGKRGDRIEVCVICNGGDIFCKQQDRVVAKFATRLTQPNIL